MSRTRTPTTAAVALGVLVAVCMTTIAGSASAQTPAATAPERLTSVVQPSIVHVRTEFSGLVRDRNGNDLDRDRRVTAGTSCSGFIVDPNGFITTSGQCLDLDLGAGQVIDTLAQRLWKRDRAGSIGHFASLAALKRYGHREWTVVSPTLPSHVRPDRSVRVAFGGTIGAPAASLRKPARVRRVRSFANGDLALVKIEAHDLPALELGDPAPVTTATVSVGFAGPLTGATAPTFAQGSITATKTLAEGLRSVYTTDVAFARGMRGGPTVDLQNRVVGVNSIDPGHSQEPDLVTPASEVEQLLRDEGVRNDVGRTNRVYRNAVDAFFGRDRAAALTGFDLALKLQPNNKLVQRFRARALRLPVVNEGMSLLMKLGFGILSFGLLSSGGGVAVHFGGPRIRRRTRKSSDSRSVDAQLPALVIQDGPSAGRRFSIASKMVIGRDRADIALSDARVSRRHAVIRPVGHGLEIEDLGSANGTSVNGETIRGKQSLNDGDLVGVGDVRLAVYLPARRNDETVVAPARPEAYIVVNEGRLAARSYPVLTETVIGRDAADVVLDDAQVSRRHAIIRWVDGELQLEDLQSTNGTWLNGARIEGSRELQHGDVVTIGPFAIEVRSDPRMAGPSATLVTD
jgi:pSer/pThr/pTyr-binding forkhead associated (FHA) protein